MAFGLKSGKALWTSVVLAFGMLHTACSNSESSFKGGAAATETTTTDELERRYNSDADAIAEAGAAVDVSPIETSEVQVQGALKNQADSLLFTFDTATLQSVESLFTLDLSTISSTIKLEEKIGSNLEKFSQKVRTLDSSTFTQGSEGKSTTEKFVQTAKKGLVDLVVIVDNSGSMADEQTKLSDKLAELLVSIKDADWQINVLTTGPAVPSGVNMNDASSEGKELCVSTLIRKGDINAAADFSKAVQAGTSGNGNEQGIRQAVVGLRCPGKNVVRAGSTVSVLIISDEDNCSLDGADCGSLPWAKENYLIDYVEKTLGRTVGKNAGFYGLIAPTKALCPTAYNAAPQYLRLLNYKSTPGSNYGNICDASYKTTLNRISDNIALQLDNSFALTNLPDIGSLSLAIETAPGMLVPIDPTSYQIKDKTVSFVPGKEPAVGSIIVASYKIGATPIFKSVTLTSDPAPGTVSVSVNGTTLAESSYAVSGRVITFNTEPPANASIKVSYRLNEALYDRFKLSAVPIAGSLKLKVNGVVSSNFTYDAAKGEIALTQIPLDGQPIEVGYDFIQGPKLTYSVSIINGAKNFRLMDGNTPVTFSLDAATQQLTIDVSIWQLNKVLSFAYDIPDGTERRFPLQGMPVADSIKLTTMVGTCSLDAGLKVVGAELIASCPVTEKSIFTLGYKYLGVQKSFALSGIAETEKGSWIVYYNGAVTTNYSRSGSTITLNFEPAIDGKLIINYTLPES